MKKITFIFLTSIIAVSCSNSTNDIMNNSVNSDSPATQSLTVPGLGHPPFDPLARGVSEIPSSMAQPLHLRSGSIAC